MWGSLIQSVECLHRKDWSPCKRKEFSFQSAFGLKAATLTVGLSSLLVCSAQFGLASPYHYLSQSLKIYLCVHTHTHTHTHTHIILEASLVAQMVKNLPVMQETWVWFLGQKDHLEKGMATHSSILAWRIPWTRGDWWATVHGVRVEDKWVTNTFIFTSLSYLFCFFREPWSIQKPIGSQTETSACVLWTAGGIFT